MIDRHAVRAVLEAGSTTAEVARQFGVSQRTVQRIVRAGEIETADDSEARRARKVGRPAVSSDLSERLVALMKEDPEAPRLELLRQLREEGKEVGTSTFYRLYARARATLPVELMVRFEGVAGEFAQFDFGQVDVRLRDGGKKRIRFAAYRLKYSRWVHVAVVDDERVESLIRALLASFEAAGGVPLRVVFDYVAGHTIELMFPILLCVREGFVLDGA